MERFRRTLIELSKYITSDVLENLKYMCKDVVLSYKMERVKSPLDLFLALEECGKISINDTQYLIDLLEAEGKPNLVAKLTPFNHGVVTGVFPESLSSYDNIPLQQQTAFEFRNVPETQLNVYRQLLRQISNSLRANDLQNLCYSSPEAEMAGIQHRANLSGTTLFNFFETRFLIAPNNLDYLGRLLNVIGRLDLQNLIDHYTRSFLGGHPSPLSGQAAQFVQQQYDHHYPANYPSYQGNNNNSVVLVC